MTADEPARPPLPGPRTHWRHPAEVTADRLGMHVERYFDHFSAADRDDIGHVIHMLRQIADND